MNEQKQFKPYIPAEKVDPELTVLSIVMGILLAVVFGAANAYLGLKVGMTISASIPAAVISMGVIRVILRRNSILESNIVQTIGSAGESLAAGAIFTLPALFLWAKEGKMEAPNMLEITLIAFLGGILGVLFMVPLRNALIVKEHNTLPYPEGTACAEVLLAGEEGGANASTVFAGMGIAALFKFIVDGVKAVPSEINFRVKGFAGEIGTQAYPALIGVGYIVGPRISSYMFAGGIVGWLVLIPAIVLFGSNTVLYPGTDTIGEIFAANGASGIWGTYIRYIGAGAVACGGIISLIKSLPLIIRTFRDSMKDLKGTRTASALRTEKDLDMRFILGGILIMILAIWLVPAVPVNLIGAIIVVVFGFFFATVSSRMVGLIGSSNNPVSGMAIATLLLATIILKATGNVGISGMQGAIAIGSIICIIAAIAGDTSQDLKTGYLLGATPMKQQMGELIGVTSAALAIGGVLYLLNAAWGFGTPELGAPQAMLMKMIVEGVMDNNLPWTLVFIGVFIAVVMEILRIPVLPFAVGLYLPVQLNACIMIGGVVRLVLDGKKTKDAKAEAEKQRGITDGVLYCSGMIAGEGLVGILLAILTVFGVADSFDLSSKVPASAGNIGCIIVIILMILCLLKFSVWRKAKSE
ncbi:oligopeptide transporter, OPT family [Clostridium sp. chh4-2]|uniref:OPT family oligopeptide transporter n=1 Tax=Clostridium sp. chh4-2 TaxID=2067550 RepID=UPI000CCECC8A|nr:oligopeptide transporter, OPT family [Clostridium sp. chh4-2]PNV63398.1 oligopeptide transporter, OPT family [Clostridium sp. chh4-2]